MHHKQAPPRPIVKGLQYFNIHEQIAFEAMISDERWISAETFRDQCRIIKEYLYVLFS